MKIIYEMYDGEFIAGRIIIHKTNGDVFVMGFPGLYNLTVCESLVSIFEYTQMNKLYTVKKYMIADYNKIGGV